MALFGKTKILEAEIDTFFDNIAQAALIFKAGLKNYMDNDLERFHKYMNEIDELEREADKLRREIRYKLYSQMLIPDARGDVLGLLENSDNVIDLTKKVLDQFDIEKPDFPDFLKKLSLELAEASTNAIDEMVKASRSFFKDINFVNDHINKVFFYEHEADVLEKDMQKKLFEAKEITSLSRKLQVRYFIERIAKLSDEAEAVCERLSVYSIKRTL